MVVKLWFKKVDKTDLGKYRGITLLNTVGKVFCKLLNDRIVGVPEEESIIASVKVKRHPNAAGVA